MKPLLTVFTPTFNRAYILSKCYESLTRQTCKAFVWLIVDDGSSDHTQELVKEWIQEGKLEIKYVYQKNQGMHGAHNTAYEHIDTELNVCIDSDDYMTDDAVEKIVSFWKQHGSKAYAGIIALDCFEDGKVIGTYLPEKQKSTTLEGFYRQGGKGDKKLIYRTEVVRSYPPYPIFEGEKYVGLNYKYMMIDRDYELLIMNEPVCIVAYQEDGSSLNMIHQYRNNPRGFAELRKVAMRFLPDTKSKFRSAIHYVSSSMMLKNKNYISESPCKGLTILATPFGMGLYLFIKYTHKSTVKR